MGVVDTSYEDLEDQTRPNGPDGYDDEASWLCAARRLQESNNNALVRTPVDSMRRDLFSAYPPVAGRPSMESIDEYVYTFTKEELCLHITPGMEHPALSVMVPMAMQDPALFKCLVTAAQSLFEWRRSPNPNQPERSRALILAQNDAIKALRTRLAKPDAQYDDGLIISVVHLMTADSSARDIQALKMHLKGARQIIALRGGLTESTVHLALRGTMATTEFYIALGQYLHLSPDDLSAVPMRPINYVGHPFPPDVCDYIAKMPPGIAEAALTGQLSVRCMRILSELTQWAPLADRSDVILPGEEATAKYSRLYCKPREFARDAMALCLDLKRAKIPPGLEHVTMLGLAAIIRHLSGHQRTDFFDHLLLTALFVNVKAIDTPSVAESEVIVWVVLVIKWRTQSGGMLQKADELLEYALKSFPATRTWKGMAKICRKFWWFGRFEAEWKITWQRGLDSRMIQRRNEGQKLQSTRRGQIDYQQQQQRQHP
ncbi:uncharacterized protein PV06_05593 [Exophiala oligosperma]|uniref:Fungal-specific transcription factor domain-containing protein n=1 Tax=Exophiala oligosperma TaxID=215243 RepID=A0A0D2BX20_9EURO|nr:uncharacterized protein PV06_05593 [Exophiala oligosperma]KIW42002.1 hypothetical protein PV06_05593 [Exophiala oligosperma]